ncbi:MAG: glycosyltransferase family 4 protein [bacterium]|nr:glycosyltransferase family 4 protein [bacterium]
MKILIPTHYFTDDPQSGLNTELWNFPVHLAAMGHEVFIVTLAVDLVHHTRQDIYKKNIRLYQIYDYKGHGLAAPEALMVFFFSVLLRLRHRFDWIFIPDAARSPFSRYKLGAKLAGRILTPETREMHELFNSGDWKYDRKHKDDGEGISEPTKPIVYRFFRFLARHVWFRVFPVNLIAENADILFCQGLEPLNFARNTGRNNPVYLPNGVQKAWFDNFGDARIDTGNKFVFLFVGRIMKSKGVFTLISIFKQLCDRYQNIELWIVGPSHGHYTRLLEEAVDGYEDKIKILGRKNREGVAACIRSCDVLVDPFIYASFSNIVLEALYCKKPVIAPRMGDTKDFVKEGVTGYLADSRNTTELMKKMEYCINHYSEAEALAVAGHEFVKKNLTVEKIVQHIDFNFKFFSDTEKVAEMNDAFECLFK